MPSLASSDVPPLPALPPLQTGQVLSWTSLTLPGGQDSTTSLPAYADLSRNDGALPPLAPLPSIPLTGDNQSPSSSSSASVSSLWDEDAQMPDMARVWTRSHTSLPRITDYGYVDAQSRPDTMSSCISEAVQEQLYIKDPSDLQGHCLAPVHATDDVLASLLQTASAGASSHHFQWEETSASFRWAQTAQHQLDQRMTAKSRQRQDLEVVLPWIGTERLCGWSANASSSVIEPFLTMAALLRRLDQRLLTIRNIRNSPCKEVSAFAFALDTVLTWLKQELRVWASNNSAKIGSSSSAILGAQAGLQVPSTLLKALGNLLSCAQPRLPPFRPLTWLNTTHACLSHLHAHLAASMASAASPLNSAVLAYLLDKTSSSWREQVARWMGFPGYTSDYMRDLEAQDLSKKGDRIQSNVAVPWSGAEIDWSLDERGEEDVGYTLRPSAVPSFLTFRSARIFLEAGRALRLLSKAAPVDHPLVNLWSSDADSAESRAKLAPGLPTWVWSPTGNAQDARIDEHIADLKGSIVIWRKQRQTQRQHLNQPNSAKKIVVPSRSLAQQPKMPISLLPSTPANSFGSPLPPLSALGFENPDELSAEDRIAHMTDMFNTLPSIGAETHAITNDPQMSAEDDLVVYLAKAISLEAKELASFASTPMTAIERSSFDGTTQQNLVAPFAKWARVINASLISVFFQDLGLRTYLETCKQFLLLGSEHFERQVTASLFDMDKRGMLVRSQVVPMQQVVAMNPVLIADGVWPPNDNLLSSALNTAVIETVFGMRHAHADRKRARSLRQSYLASEDASALAYKDLEERLSFAIVEPSSSTATTTKGRTGKPTWMDPSSIDALDWLTLSFHPPPLISPLLTHLAQSRYQRLWNALLRIKRCKVAMRTAWQTTFKSTSALFTFDFTLNSLMHQMRWSLTQFLNAYGSFVQEIGIETEWTRFMKRLDRVKREVSDELTGAVPARRRKVNATDAGDLAEDGTDGELDADQDAHGLNEEQKQAQMTSNQLELKDVFSLARYHERVLDRMLDLCFLKTRQRGLAKIVNTLLQCCLDFSQMCSDYHAPPTNGAPPQYEDFRALHKHFQSRIDTFVQALVLVKDRQRPPETQLRSEHEAVAEHGEATLPKRRRDIENERHRMAHDELEDLRKLDTDVRGKGADQSDTETSSNIEVLLVRLNAAGFYGDTDYL